jgi:hypothetical protein
MTRRPDGWLKSAADPAGLALDDALEDLVLRLGNARASAEQHAARAPLGLREVELAMGARTYLCAFDGPGFLCLTHEGRPVTDAHVVQRTATVSLVWEQLEAEIDVSRLGEVSSAAARVLALTDEPAVMSDAIGATAEHAMAMAQWRESPLRAIASLTQIDVLFALQERANRAYGRFVQASEHLVAQQEQMTPELVATLGGFERAAITAGLGMRLADRLGAVVSACDQGAAEIVAAHLTPLDSGLPGAGR